MEVQHVSMTKSYFWTVWRLMIALIGVSVAASTLLRAQAKPAAIRSLNTQFGGTIDFESPDYHSAKLFGFGLYSTIDWRPHFGVEVSLHQLMDSNSTRKLRVQTFEAGPRYVLRLGPWNPYVKLLVGRGSFRFPPDPRYPANGSVATLGYTFWSGGAGTDYRLNRSINLRVDYEWQRWVSFPPYGRSPQVFSLGAAYHFH